MGSGPSKATVSGPRGLTRSARSVAFDGRVTGVMSSSGVMAVRLMTTSPAEMVAVVA